MVSGFQSYFYEEFRKASRPSKLYILKLPMLDLVNRILAKMGQDVTAKTLARIAVEVGEEEEDIRLLV